MLLVKGWGLLTDGLSGHLEPGSARAVGTRGLLWAEEGSGQPGPDHWDRPRWGPGCCAQPGHALALPFVSEMVSRRGSHRDLGYQLRGIQNTSTFDSASFSTLPRISLPVPR